MAKPYFASKEKRGPGIGRIVAALVAVTFLAAAGLWGYQRIRAIVGTAPATLDATTQIEQAEALEKQGNWQGVRDLLTPLATRITDPQDGPKVVMLLARAQTQTGNPSEALTIFEWAMSNYASSPLVNEIAAGYAQALRTNGRNEEAARVEGRLVESAPPGQRAPGLLGMAAEAETAQDLLKARDFFRQALDDAPAGSDSWTAAVDGIGRMNVTLIFSPQETPESKVYSVESRDNLMAIGMKLNTTQGLLTRANRLDDAAKLNIGQRLKYTPKDFRIVIERSTCRLYLMDKDGLFKRYATGLGMPGYETTLGEYTIGNKEQNPTWHKPGSAPIPPLDPQNELGTRWMPLIPAAEGLPKDLGIHGTIHPETVGQYKSHGCPRLCKEDVEELYDLVVRSTPVSIVETFDLAKAGKE